MFWVYIIFSSKVNQYYVGHSGDLAERLLYHQSGRNKSTKKASDWKLVYREFFETKSEAMQREQEIKKKKSRIYIEYLINRKG